MFFFREAASEAFRLGELAPDDFEARDRDVDDGISSSEDDEEDREDDERYNNFVQSLKARDVSSHHSVHIPETLQR